MKKNMSVKNLIFTAGVLIGTATVTALHPIAAFAETDDVSEQSVDYEDVNAEYGVEAEAAEASFSGVGAAADNEKDTSAEEKVTEEEAPNEPETPVVKNGFVFEGSSWMYYKDDRLYTAEDIVQGTLNEESGWFYVKDGRFQAINSVEVNSNGWWYIRNGRVDFGYTGFAENKNGWWYIENGKVTFNKNEVTYGTVGRENGWWNVKDSKVTFNESIEPNRYGWWYVKNGKVDFSKTGVEQNSNGWFYVKNGKVDFTKNGVEQNKNGWWYIRNGKVDFGYTGFAQNSNGWWYIENGKVTFNKNEVTYGTVRGESGWWNVKGSKVIFNESIEPNRYGWWYVKNGKVDFSKTGVEQNANGWWYVNGGKVQFGHTGVEQNKNGWWYIRNGKVDFGFTGIASNKNGTWYIVNGKVDFNANGTRSVGGVTYTVSNGRITGTVSGTQAEMINKAKNYVTSTGYMILVDRSACKVGVFRGSGNNSSLEKYWSCCVGAYSTPTITGVYKLGAKGLYFNTGTTGRCWYYSQIKGDYLFHSVIYDRSSSPVNIIDGTMGRKVSHGCIRLNVENAKYIYLNIPSGSTIVIYN